MNQPSYDEVRNETNVALERIVDLIPDPKDVDTGAEQDPYSCSNPVLPAQENGAFYTGHQTVQVRDDMDVVAFIESLPTQLGDGWRTEDLGVKVSFAAVDVVENSTGVSVAVEDHSVDGRRVIDLVAISRCGFSKE